MSSYFEMFPLFDYDGSRCVDITRRVGLRRTVSADPKAFQPYEVPAGERPDQIAAGYYESPERSWMVLLSVEALDPYFDWYLSPDRFASFIVDKYGSFEEAVERVHHWQENWPSDPTELSPGQWDQLDGESKAYYEPVFGKGTAILSYVRREDGLTASTNMIVTVDLGPDHGIVPGERVRVFSGAVPDGQAEAGWANSTHVKLLQVQANTDPGVTLVGVSSGSSALVHSREYTANVIPIDERPFWSPVSMLDHETDRNESRKNVRLLDSRNASSIEAELSRLLVE